MNGASRPVTATVMAIFAIAGLASSAMARQGQSTDGQQSPPGASAERLTIKTKSCPPVAGIDCRVGLDQVIDRAVSVLGGQ